MFTSTATATAAVRKILRGLGDQPRLLAHSIIARPRQHSVIEVYMIRLAARSGRCGAPRFRATEVSGSSTGGVATLGWGAVAHRPLNATPAMPSALRMTAGSGRASGLCDSTRISRPIKASTLPPVIGGSASRGSAMSVAVPVAGGSGSASTGKGSVAVVASGSPGGSSAGQPAALSR